MTTRDTLIKQAATIDCDGEEWCRRMEAWLALQD